MTRTASFVHNYHSSSGRSPEYALAGVGEKDLKRVDGEFYLREIDMKSFVRFTLKRVEDEN